MQHCPGASGGKQQTLSRGPPKLAIENALHQAGTFKQLGIAHQAVSRDLQLAAVRTRRPLFNGDGCLDNALALKQTVRPVLINAIERGVHLAAHGVRRHTK